MFAYSQCCAGADITCNSGRSLQLRISLIPDLEIGKLIHLFGCDCHGDGSDRQRGNMLIRWIGEREPCTSNNGRAVIEDRATMSGSGNQPVCNQRRIMRMLRVLAQGVVTINQRLQSAAIGGTMVACDNAYAC